MTTMRKKILIIEDCPDLGLLMGYCFEKLGHEVFSAPDGRSGLLAVKIHRPDVVLLDRTLTDMDGRDVCRALRESGDRTPLLFYTGRRGDPKCERCASCASVELYKPTSPTRLVSETLAMTRPGEPST